MTLLVTPQPCAPCAICNSSIRFLPPLPYAVVLDNIINDLHVSKLKRHHHVYYA